MIFFCGRGGYETFPLEEKEKKELVRYCRGGGIYGGFVTIWEGQLQMVFG